MRSSAGIKLERIFNSVVLPEPVPPTSKTRPRFSLARSPSNGGNRNSANALLKILEEPAPNVRTALEELVEQLTWSQLGQHAKPIIIANIAKFWSPFLYLLQHMRDDAFIRPGIEVTFAVVDEAEKIVPTMLTALDARVNGERINTLEKL